MQYRSKLLSIRKYLVLLVLPVIAIPAVAQDMPQGLLVNRVNCSLNEGVTMPQVVQWARSQPRTGPQPGAEFYREAVVNGNLRQNYDFVIATYFQSFSHILEVNLANLAAPANRVQPTVRAQDLYTCNPATQSTTVSRTVNPDNDGFTGDATVMHSRFCLLAEGETIEDAWDFATAVNENYSDAGDSSLMQLNTRMVGPIPGENMSRAGRGVSIAVVPSTPQAWAQRMDMPQTGFQPLRGVSSPFENCNYPAVWITHAVWRAPAQ